MQEGSIARSKLMVSTHMLWMYALFAISCLNRNILIVWIIIMPIYLILQYGKAGAVEFFIFLQLRSLLSTGIAVGFDGILASIKWGIVFLLSVYLLLGYRKMKNAEISNVIFWVVILSVVSIISAWMTSSYPVTASFKVLSYAIPFTAILKGVSETEDCAWIKKITQSLGILVLGSAVLLNSSIGYLRNGRSFQGVFNHPNVYGVMLSIFVAGYLYQQKRLSVKAILVIGASLFLLYQTGSRTGMISVMVTIVVFLATQDLYPATKALSAILVVVVTGLVLSLDGSLSDAIMNYLYKGNSDNIFASRTDQIANNMSRFLKSPILGTGFNVPYVEGVRTYAFSFDLITENGNLFMAILGDIGVIGMFLFLITYGKIFLLGKGTISTIFLAPFLVCMGEMAFFSTNNFGIILYLYFAIYAVNGCKNEYELDYGGRQ